MSSNKIIGIDLGTTNTCAAILKNGIVEPIPNSHDEILTPSVVFYDQNSVVVGEDAVNQIQNHHNIISVIKRLMGQQFKDKKVQESLATNLYTVVSDNNGNAAVKLKFPNNEPLKLPQEVSADILKEIRRTASEYLAEDIKKTVITVPAHFRDHQREATRQAVRLAGLELVKMVNEPSAAALHFARNMKVAGERLALVYDLGGGTFDVSIVRLTQDSMDVVGISGDTHLGGYDFDRELVEYIMKKSGSESIDKMQARRLLQKAEEAKVRLSSYDTAKLNLKEFFRGRNLSFSRNFRLSRDLDVELTRQEFEDIILGAVRKTIEVVDKCITESRINKEEIDEIILVGGSTRVPLVQKELKKYFDGKVLNTSIDPDVAVAEGAAIQAAFLSDDPEQSISDFSVHEIITSSLGIEVQGGTMNFLIRKNAPLPLVSSTKYSTTYENQSRLVFTIYEGESRYTHNNFKLGDFTIDNIPAGPARSKQILVTFSVDENGVLKISAKETSGGRKKDLTVHFDTGKLTDLQISEMIKRVKDAEFTPIHSFDDGDLVEDELY